MINTGIKVFSQLYVGYHSQTNSAPLGFATPYEDNAAGKKRMATVDEWREKKIKPNILDNVPRGPFKITDDLKRTYWGGGNVVFRVEDPLGFELEIQSQNLMAIIQVAGINAGGDIPGNCLWGRDSGKNILLHESSEEFKNAILAAETIKKPNQLKSLVVGQNYKLLNGDEVTYLGPVWAALSPKSYEDRADRYSRAKYLGVCGSKWIEMSHTEATLGPSEKFEAALSGENVILYKKVPAISVASKTGRSDVGAVLEETKISSFSLASSAFTRKFDIRNVTVGKIDDPVFAFQKVNAKIFKAIVSKLKDDIKHELRYTKIAAGVSRMFCQYSTQLVLKDGDDYYADGFYEELHTRTGTGTLEIIQGIAPMKMSQKHLSIYTHTPMYNRQYLSNSDMQYRYGASKMGNSPSATKDKTALDLTGKLSDNPLEKIDWLIAQYEAGNVGTIKAVNKNG